MSKQQKDSGKIDAVAMHVFGFGMGLGFSNEFNVLADCETFTAFQESVTKNRPDVSYRLHPDGEFDYADMKGIPLLFGNPRCSGFSCVNAGIPGKHGHDAAQTIDLRQFWKATRDLQPQVAVWESVQQASSVGRPLLDAMYEDLAQHGYRFAEIKFNNKDIGVPQQRKRFFGVAYKDGLNFNVDIPQVKSKTMFQAIGDLVDIPAGAFVNRNMTKCICDDKVYGKVNGRPVYNHVAFPFPPEEACVIKYLKEGDSLYELTDEQLKTSAKLWKKKQDGKGFSWAPPQRGYMNGLSRVIYSRSFTYIHPTLDRSLTVRESARLMGFPDGWVFWGTHPLVQIGNGVSVTVASWVAGEVKKALTGAWGGEDFQVTWNPKKKQLEKKDATGQRVKVFELNQLDKHTG
jgi:site-specific DNA-cytosine methylase